MPLFRNAALFTRGVGTLVNGTVAISNAAAFTSSMIQVSCTNSSGTNVGALRISSKADGSFIVSSTNALDTSTFDYLIANL